MDNQGHTIEFNYYGGRDYVDIAQISYRVLRTIGIDVSCATIESFNISIEQPVPNLVTLVPSEAVSRYEQTLVQFSFLLQNKTKKFSLINHPDGPRPNKIKVDEIKPVQGMHWVLGKDKIFWKTSIHNEWPVFHAFMLMGRFSGIYFFGSEKPRGVRYSMKRIPRPEEVSKLWVSKKRGPIKGFGVIDLWCGDQRLGESLLKI